MKAHFPDKVSELVLRSWFADSSAKQPLSSLMWTLHNPKHQQHFTTVALDTHNKTSTEWRGEQQGTLLIPFPLPKPLLLA